MKNLNKALLSGSLVLLITINLYNLSNFFFQWSMARLLTVVQYGELAALVSIIYLFAIITESMQTVVAKSASTLPGNGEAKNLIKRSLRKSLKFAFISFILYILISIYISRLLKIDYMLLALNGLLIFPIYLATVSRGVLQGRKLFSAFGFSMIVEGVSKIIIGVLLVYAGFQVYGAVAAIILAVACSFIFSLFALKRFFSAEEKYSGDMKGLYSYAHPVLLANAIILIFSTLDILIAKIVFDSVSAGYYAISSVIAKIIFLGTNPIGKAMFPITSGLKGPRLKSKSKSTLLTAFLLLLLIIIVVLPILYFFPEFLVKIFSGKEIIESSSILFYLGIAFSFCSVTNLLLMYNLSKSPSSKTYSYLALIILVQIALFAFFSSSLKSFSIAFIAASICFLIATIILTRK